MGSVDWFDLEKFDWVEPHGGGTNGDMLVRFGADIKNAYFDFKISMDICFTNHPHAGAYVCKKEPGSDFQWAYCVDASNVFISEFSYVVERRPDGTRIVDTLPSDSYMVFRTRTKIDGQGNLISAHYGVISGECLFGSETMRVDDVCFNGTANDMNLEDGYFLRKKVDCYSHDTRDTNK